MRKYTHMKILVLFLVTLVSGAFAQTPSAFKACDGSKTIAALLKTQNVRAVLKQKKTIYHNDTRSREGIVSLVARKNSSSIRDYGIDKKINITSVKANQNDFTDSLITDDKALESISIPANYECTVSTYSSYLKEYVVHTTVQGNCPKEFVESNLYTTRLDYTRSKTIYDLSFLIGSEISFECQNR
jgi:hypothetical protein